MTDLAQVTLPQWQSFLIILAAILASIVLTGNAIKTVKEIRKPQTDILECLDNDKRRLKKLEEKEDQRDEEFAIILRSMMVMMHHMIDGNNIDKLEKMYDQINEFLLNRK